MNDSGLTTLLIVNKDVLDQDIVQYAVNETTYDSSEPVSPVEEIARHEGHKLFMVPETICFKQKEQIYDDAWFEPFKDTELTFSTPHGIATLGRYNKEVY